MEREAAVVSLILCACSGSSVPRSTPEPEPTQARLPATLPDIDEDGLCDFTEGEVGTHPGDSDTDADGLPDRVELLNGFDPSDAASPALDQLGYLEGVPGGQVELPVEFALAGAADPELRGAFEALPATDPEGRTAADFWAGASIPADSPRDGTDSRARTARMPPASSTERLGFRLRFAYPLQEGGPDPPACARTYPFRIALTTAHGRIHEERLFLLIVVPPGSASALRHCQPAECE